ncbi:hypothetical protein [Leptobacterium sp. I13]|uniref:hypothetical protein n=1 Tax=Leptobacterium meishanense TaxID=3128904 RepID=UPI0030EE7596
MQLKNSLIVASLFVIIFITFWEIYSRANGYIAVVNDDKALWAVNRAKVDHATANDVVIIGSSRAHFDIQLDEWEKAAGVRPIMLASDGTVPAPVLKDIVENTGYKGTLLIGVTPGLFFSPPHDSIFVWRRAQVRNDFFHKRTYAQRLNHVFSVPLQHTFAFLNASEEEWADDIDLKSLLKRVQIGNRTGPKPPPFYNFQSVDLDRNVTMFEKVVTDTAFAGTIKKVWMFFGKNAPPPVKKEVLDYYTPLIKKFEDRGGTVIFSRFPSSGGFREGERIGLPRNEYWDLLLKETGVPGYHFEDYDVLNQFYTPEWSHLATPDAKIYTREFVKILQNDGFLK